MYNNNNTLAYCACVCRVLYCHTRLDDHDILHMHNISTYCTKPTNGNAYVQGHDIIIIIIIIILGLIIILHFRTPWCEMRVRGMGKIILRTVYILSPSAYCELLLTKKKNRVTITFDNNRQSPRRNKRKNNRLVVKRYR